MHITIVNRAMGIYRAGAERFDYEIAIALQGIGIGVEMVTGKRMRSVPDRPVHGVPTHYVATPFLREISQRIAGRMGNLILRLDQFLFELLCAKYLREHCTSDIIQVCSLPHLVRLQSEMNVPVIIWFPGIPSTKYLPMIRKAAAVVANGDAFLHIRSRFRKDAVHVPLGVDLEKFRRRPTDLRQRLGINGNPVILYTGRMAPIKDIPLLLQAFALVRKELSDARLILVGTGPSRGEIEGRIRDMNLNSAVHMPGFVKDEQGFAEYYAAADVFALSSSYDNDPNVIYEAMSSSLPIVATRVGGIPLLVKDGVNGFLVDHGNAPALAQRLVNVLTDARMKEQMGEANRRAAQPFSWDASARRLIELYREICNRHNGSSCN
jgi:glycosyltransferase involved in cell wall biosynthesis